MDQDMKKIGLVIGTFAAVPYVHLQLEFSSRLHPKIPVLVHDDRSPAEEILKSLCRKYCAGFQTNQSRLGWRSGDYSVILHGIEWGLKEELDIVVKMSRRFIPLFNWIPGLLNLCQEDPAATYSGPCSDFGFPIRSECMAVNTAAWAQAVPVMTRILEKHALDVNECPEHHIRALAYLVAPKITFWKEILGSGRKEHRPGVLWHDVDSPFDYCRVSKAIGLDYTLADFEDIT
jgi:hypothetical protein